MKTKYKFLLILLLSLISLNCKSQEIKRVDIKFVDISIETPFQIKCADFEDFFLDEINRISIENREQILELSKIIKGLEKADLTKYSAPDTRVKIEIFNDNKKSSICMDRFVVSLSDDLYLLSDSMLAFLETIIKSKKECE